jgi:TM2 domain-containing membrane protein YozV
LDTGDAAQGQCCDFADFLMRRQSCQSAMLEYERVLYRETEPACKKKAALGLLKTSSIVNNLDGFVTTFHLSLNSAGRDREFSAACGMLLARRYYAAGRYGDALGALSAYVLSDSAGILDKRRLLAALCRLSVYRTDAAMAVADSISTESPLSKFTQTLRREKKRFEGPERSPLAAGMLSTVVPGAGYLYAGRPATALASLIVNGLFFWTTYDFFAGKHYAAATTSLVLGAGFYMGNIRGSIRAARATSAKDRRKKIALLLEGVPVDW